MHNLIETGLAHTLVVNKLSVVLFEARRASRGSSASLAKRRALRADSRAGVIVASDTLAIVGGITSGVVRASVTDSSY